MHVKELASMTATPAHVIRYYTQIGLLNPERDPNNDYRDYASADVNRVRFIRHAKLLGFTLNDIAEVLRNFDRGFSSGPGVRHLIVERAAENRIRLDDFSRLQCRMESVIAEWVTRPDRGSDCDNLRDLVEAVADA